MRALVLCDDYWHHAPIPRAGLTALAGDDFQFDWIENAADWSPERMSEYPLVVLVKSNDVSATDRSNWMTPEAEQAFVDYVSRGGGLLAVHSGTAGYLETKALRALLGGVFAHHPKQCPVEVLPHAGHPMTACSTSFTAQDEHYFMEMDDEQADIFVTTRSEHGSQPGGWRRTHGQGRVCVLTPGHNDPVWQHASFQALLRNALTWCGTGQ
jgi:uncharacterized protein